VRPASLSPMTQRKPPTSDAKCAVCGDLDPIERTAMREQIDTIPLHGRICVECFRAFWRNIGFGRMIEGPTGH
jgi:hypothetical protein